MATACVSAQTQDAGFRYRWNAVAPVDTACRFGRDEFVILPAELEGQETAAAAAGKIRTHPALPYFIDRTEIELATSMGMALYPVDGHRYEQVLRRSDVAMYCDKARGLAKPSFGCDAVGRT